MNLRRQLFLVSLLTLVLPWAGCQFIKETESALREGQQDMLAGTAQAIADSLSQFPADFLSAGSEGVFSESQLYGHPLDVEPSIDGYGDDWTAGAEAQRSLRGADGDIRFRIGLFRRHLFLLADVQDRSPLDTNTASLENADRVELLSVRDGGARERYVLATGAPGALIGRREENGRLIDESRVQATWLTTPEGYRIEARIPLEILGDYIGLTFINERGTGSPVRSATFDSEQPGRFIRLSPVLMSVIGGYARQDLRLIVTDTSGWRLAVAGGLSDDDGGADSAASGWQRIAYQVLLEQGDEAAFAEPDPRGRERQGYVVEALNGNAQSDWFRSASTGRAVVAVAQPVWSGNVQTGTVILQQGTAAILSLANDALGRLVSFTLIATLVVALALIGYASWLSLRIRRLSQAAGQALTTHPAALSLPSAASGDEIGDLSRNFADVLGQLGNYNEYLRTLASKLSHELRTPLTIVNSSLENLEHEDLSEEATQYTARARYGTARLKKILDAMSEANRVEELMQSVDTEVFDLRAVIASVTEAYSATWPDRRFSFECTADTVTVQGSPDLLLQLLDKLVDNAVGFSADADEIHIRLAAREDGYRLSIVNPGQPLPEKMRERLFDSMVSMRPGDSGEHLGLGLYIARLIAEGHGGKISAENTGGGVAFHVDLPK